MNWLLITTTFLTVNLDFFVILLFLCQRFPTHKVLVGYLLGLLILISAAFLCGQILQKFLPEWVLGVLGIIPIISAFKDDDDEPSNHKTESPILTTLITYLSVCAGCNLSLFLPVLANQNWTSFLLILGYVAVLTVIIVYLIAYFGHRKVVHSLINKWGEPLMKICYVGIGLYVFYDSGLIEHLLKLI